MKQVIHNSADYTDSSTAWNDAGNLAPVGSDIMIIMPPGTVIHHPDRPDPAVSSKQDITQAVRTQHLAERGNAMQYQLLDGSSVYGRFRWTHA